MRRTSDGIRAWQRGLELAADELAAVWHEFRHSLDGEARNLLMEHYLPLVKYNSERLHAKLPDEVDLDDLVSAGIDGLRDAIESFDQERGVKFETYCAPRIRGAILDALRSMDWVPRLVRARANQLAEGRRRIEARLGRAPLDHELAAFMGLSEAAFGKLARDAHAVGVISLNRNYQDNDSTRDVRETDIVPDPRSENPLRQVQQHDLRSLITKGLSKPERLILLLYYYEEMTMKEIGATLDLSESRVSQMHSAIITRLRTQLDGRQHEFTPAEA